MPESKMRISRQKETGFFLRLKSVLVSPLKAAREDSDEYVKKAAVGSLGKTGTKKAAAALTALKAGGNEKLASWAGNVLKSLGPD